MSPISPFGLPENLEQLCLSRFDDLHSKGRILYEPTKPEYVTHEGFKFEFRVCPYLKNKPIKGPEPDVRNKAGGPFLNPKDDEVVTRVGDHHRIMLNTFCMYRPMLLITTVNFELQNDPLNRRDLEALWASMKAMKTPQIAFYNCGVYSGSSQGHKHMQLVPKPDPTSFELFPSRAASTEEIASSIENVPFKHYVLKLPSNATFEDVYPRYERLLEQTKFALKEAGQGTDHNVLITSEWIALIPRSISSWNDPCLTNSLGMVGCVTVLDQKERDTWTKVGYTAHMRKLGIRQD